jgi:DNA-binding NarL/FixJ family response regulator
VVKKPCRIVIAWSDLHFRNTLAESCRESDLTVVGQCGDYARLLRQLRNLEAEVAVVERALPGFDALSQLGGLHERIPTLILDLVYDEATESMAQQLQAGYVLANDEMHFFADTVRRLRAREQPHPRPHQQSTAPHPPPPLPKAEPKILFGRYELLSTLGGNMGIVHVARDLHTNQKVAVKVLPEGYTNDHLQRLRRESEALKRISHPNVVRLLECSHTTPNHYLVLEFIEGPDLRKLLKKGPLPVAEALHLATQAADGLEASHRAGVLHRDVKPGNLVVLPSLNIRVIDYGAATFATPTIIEQDDDTIFRTMEGYVVGTPGYQSPEQIEGRPLDERCDIYALATVLYEMAEGKHPLRVGDAAATYFATLNTMPPRAEKLGSAWPIVEKGLAKRPGERWRNMAEFAAALRAIHPGSNP